VIGYLIAAIMVVVGYCLVAVEPTPVTYVIGGVLFLGGIVVAVYTHERGPHEH
jgi:hypothetical protein